MSDSINKGSTPNDALSQDADRVFPRHTVDGKNAATGESTRMINEVESDDHGSRAQRGPQRADGFNPNDAGGRGSGGEKGRQDDGGEETPYTDTKPAEVASESHSLPGPKSVGAGQKSKGHNPTQ